MKEHFNVSTGTYVNNPREFADDLKRKSEAATLSTGLEHNFVPVDPADQREVFGITDEGLDDQVKRHTELGWREPVKFL
jgi:hypothetical protein